MVLGGPSKLAGLGVDMETEAKAGQARGGGEGGCEGSTRTVQSIHSNILRQHGNTALRNTTQHNNGNSLHSLNMAVIAGMCCLRTN